jgi:hypothetical protein
MVTITFGRRLTLNIPLRLFDSCRDRNYIIGVLTALHGHRIQRYLVVDYEI